MTEVEDTLDPVGIELFLSLTVDAAPVSVGRVRSLMARTVQGWTGCDEEVVYTVEVLLSELVTNAVRYTTGSDVTVQAQLNGRELTLRAIDSCGKPPKLSIAEEGDEGGRGLMLCAALADEWDWRSRAVGKEVWARLTVPGPGGMTPEGEHGGDGGKSGDPGLLHGRAERVGGAPVSLDVRA
jgi:anti-sigma regulatory factor (Ser/Thr protein kinase)